MYICIYCNITRIPFKPATLLSFLIAWCKHPVPDLAILPWIYRFLCRQLCACSFADLFKPLTIFFWPWLASEKVFADPQISISTSRAKVVTSTGDLLLDTGIAISDERSRSIVVYCNQNIYVTIWMHNWTGGWRFHSEKSIKFPYSARQVLKIQRSSVSKENLAVKIWTTWLGRVSSKGPSPILTYSMINGGIDNNAIAPRS